MKIVCLNGWGGKMYEPLINYIQATDPDILCLQEVVHSPETSLDWLTYRDGDHVLPQRANFFRDIADALPNHTGTFCPAAQGILWDDDTSVPSQWGLATFVRKTIPVIGQKQAFVHKGFSANGYGEHPRSRSAHAIRIYDMALNAPITISHMHGLRDLAGKMDTPERAEQARKLLELTMDVADESDPTIVCGDFNVEPDSETFRILAEEGLKDLVIANGFTSTRNSLYKKPGRFADYMLVNDAVRVKSFGVVMSPEVSDHCPLILEI